jgi:hypothetical protein
MNGFSPPKSIKSIKKVKKHLKRVRKKICGQVMVNHHIAAKSDI